MVDFCKDCGALIMGKKGEEVVCPSCGKTIRAEKEINLTKNIQKKEEIEIINKDESEAEIHPITDIDCPKCKHNKAYYWTKQTRAGDEPETQFYKCEKCKNQWREYR